MKPWVLAVEARAALSAGPYEMSQAPYVLVGG